MLILYFNLSDYVFLFGLSYISRQSQDDKVDALQKMRVLFTSRELSQFHSNFDVMSIALGFRQHAPFTPNNFLDVLTQRLQGRGFPVDLVDVPDREDTKLLVNLDVWNRQGSNTDIESYKLRLQSVFDMNAFIGTGCGIDPINSGL